MNKLIRIVLLIWYASAIMAIGVFLVSWADIIRRVMQEGYVVINRDMGMPFEFFISIPYSLAALFMMWIDVITKSVNAPKS